MKGKRTSYLVCWHGYPPSHDSWAGGAQLMIDVEGIVHQNDETHPMAQKVHRKTRDHGVGRAIAGQQLHHASEKRCALKPRAKKGSTPPFGCVECCRNNTDTGSPTWGIKFLPHKTDCAIWLLHQLRFVSQS